MTKLWFAGAQTRALRLKCGFGALLWLSVFLVSACNTEVSTVGATAVVITVQSDLGADLASAEATVFDEAGAKMGGTHTFALAGDKALKLPFSFSVVPSGNEVTGGFLVLVKGLDSAGNLLTESKARATFLAHKTRLLRLWLAGVCRGVLCPSDQTCSYEEGSRTAIGTCGAIPSPKLDEYETGSDEDPNGFPVLGVPATPQPMNDAGSDAGIELAPNLPTVGNLRSLGEMRTNSDGTLMLYDDGFEESERVCNRDGWCAVAGFVP